MPDTKITALLNGAPWQSGDILPGARGAGNVRGTIDDLRLYMHSNLYPMVNTFADLPVAAVVDRIYIVRTTTGLFGFRKLAGMWRDNGTSWDYLGLYGRSAVEIAFTPAGTIAAVDVQAALQELDGDIQGHIGTGGAAHAAASGAVAGFMAAADKTKLDGVASGATANSSDAALLARANHTGTQAIATIAAAATARLFGRVTAAAGPGEELTAAQAKTLLAVVSTDLSDFTEASQDVIGAMVAAAGGTYNDAANSITLPGTASFVDLGDAPMTSWTPDGTSTTVTAIGAGALSATGALTGTAAIATTNAYTAARLVEHLVTVAATTAVAGWRYAANKWFMGNVANRGGFKVICRFGPATGVATTTNRCFVGMSANTAAATDVEPNTLINMIGAGWGAADANIQIYRNDGTGVATAIDLGANFPVPTADRTKVYELRLSVPANSTTITYVFTDIDNPAQAVTGTLTTDIPAANTLLSPRGQMSVGGTSSVIGIALGILAIQG